MSILEQQIAISENAVTNRVDMKTGESLGLFEVLIEKNDYFADGHRYPDNRAFWRGSGKVSHWFWSPWELIVLPFTRVIIAGA